MSLVRLETRNLMRSLRGRVVIGGLFVVSIAALAIGAALGELHRRAGERDAKASFEQSMRVGLKSVLVSPDFLFLREKPGKLDDFALASRLSYFLWSSLPDETLAGLAAAGKLRDPAVLEAQARRMLRSPKAKALSTNFAAQWLQLDAFLLHAGRALRLGNRELRAALCGALLQIDRHAAESTLAPAPITATCKRRSRSRRRIRSCRRI